MDSLHVCENGRTMIFGYEALLNYHGGAFPGGVVHALKAMQAAFPQLSKKPLERREISIVTAFTGPGGHDCLECVTRAVSDRRITVDRSLGGGHAIDDPPGPYLFRFAYRGMEVEAKILQGHVRRDFLELGALANRTDEQQAKLDGLKQEMAERLLPLDATTIYEVRAP